MKRNISAVTLPFTSDAFIEAWEGFKQMRWEVHKFKYKSAYSEQAALHTAMKCCDQTEQGAIDYIINVTSRQWRGFFPINTNSNAFTKNGQQSTLNAAHKQSIFDELQQLANSG